ncbi:MAG TPA: EAL domain-containing protein [Thermoanaerobaculia bacterium]|nr:EAL domain-containing protein [Thermoanaerobaculia bacterium]
MTQHEILLILDDDATVTEALAASLERPERTVITCGDREAAELALARVPVSLMLSDIRLTGPFAFEGLDLLRDLAGRVHGGRIVLMTGESNDAIREEARRRGAVGVLEKPFDVETLERLLPERDPSAPDSHERLSKLPPVIRIPTLDEVIQSPHLRPAFQPVIVLGTEKPDIFAYESLARFRGSAGLFDTVYLFEYAAKKKRVGDLDLVCMDRSFEHAVPLAKLGKIFINIHPRVLENGQVLVRRLTEASVLHKLPLDRVVIEITEQASIVSQDAAIDCINELRALGVEFALDDVGIAYSHLSLIDRIRPSFLKISQLFGTAFEQDSTKEKIVRNIASLAKDFGCETILEGIEERETAVAAAQIGIRYAQGYYFARPAEASTFLQ